MAKRAEGFIGEFVYPAFNPKRVGIIRKVWTQRAPSGTCDVKVALIEFNDGKAENGWVSHFNSFQSLIDDHRKKLEGHEQRLEKFKKNFKL